MPVSSFRHRFFMMVHRLRQAAAQRPFSRIISDQRGATAVEMALIAVPMLFTLGEILQSGLFVYFSGQLDHATQIAARQILTGTTQNGATNAASFQTNVLCPLLPAAMSCSNVIVNLQSFSGATYPSGFNAFVNSSQTGIIIPPLSGTQTSFCPGTPGEYVYLQVFYPMPLLGNVWLPVTTTVLNGQTVKLIGSSAAFRNEPYQATTNTPYQTSYPTCS